ncbi:hypothetical protein V8G61_12920 [Gaetbulibacter sp. M240]|uniref:hypothetical protein n=1 Tax=Gaetbulibacter sp. M240 TaxID=3126511 RepID=UPI00374F65FB
MKSVLPLILVILFVAKSFAQIENQNKSKTIPAIESKKDSSDVIVVKPIIPEKKDNSGLNGMNVPSVLPKFEMPQKSFSMLPQEQFGNPGELFDKRFQNKSNDIKRELNLGTKGSKTDQFFGEIKTKSKKVRVRYRDYGEQDGDLIRVFINNNVLQYRVLLANAFGGFEIDLKEGQNVFDFLAINEGYLVPNTAHFQIIDEDGNVLASDMWALSQDVKATIIITKE